MLEESPIGVYNFNVVRNLIEDFNILQVGVGVEIGVFDGGTSWFLLKSFPTLKLLSVDPYKAYHEYDQPRMNQAEATALDRLSPFGERSVRLKMTSHTVASQIPDESLDFVFIDADHTYDAVKEDIAAWYPKVRLGGLFCGHDYLWDGVKKAVNEFSEMKSLNGFYSPQESDVWWFLRSK